ncbi:hypothetical protein GCM10010211_06740 [Streptomyces albospinus]|uniref:DUF4232 domain-containing protein n=1 Tax=Streptomyces albospinus TaxID=285515 RepID=A0ABQ2UN01_9ACTN|nr:DUF4232 domain-containing protein [Streptomyces albospinus]GGU45526.1 hypothetical protein GCM10010211_06740 [Streptomyces albospinus]
MSHTTLRHGRRAAAAGLIAVAALGLTACNGAKSDAAGSPSGSASAAADPGGSGGSGDGGTSGGTAGGSTGAKSTSAGHRSHAGQGSHAGAAGGRCTTGGLQAGWGSEGGGIPDMKSDSQQTAAVWLKNIGKASCTLDGFPGVQIKGTDGTTWDLRRSAKKPAPVTLKPGAHTQFTIELLPTTGKDDKKVEPGLVTVTPPNEKKPFALKWPYGGAILDQSGATHPGTFVNPVNG